MELKSDKAKMRLDKLDSKTRAKLVERCVLATGRLPHLSTFSDTHLDPVCVCGHSEAKLSKEYLHREEKKKQADERNHRRKLELEALRDARRQLLTEDFQRRIRAKEERIFAVQAFTYMVRAMGSTVVVSW